MENIPRLWMGRSNIVKISITPKAIYGFHEISIKIPVAFSQKYKNNSKICAEPQRAPKNQSDSDKEEQIQMHHMS